MRDLTEREVRELIERYPFLIPRNVFTDEVSDDYDYTYIRGLVELPKGWHELFLQMCEDIRQPLIDAGYLEEFRFSQIKEKYNTMRCYHFGAPEKVADIISKYEMMASYICTNCGKPAVYETQGYIASYCEDCWKDFVRHDRVVPIEFQDHYQVSRYSKEKGRETVTISFKNEWNRYLERIEK